MKQLFLTVIFLFSLSLLMATSLTTSGPLTDNTVWDVDTVFVAGNVIVPNDTTLTINPGVKVEFQGYYSLDIYGTLLAEGTSEDMIYFTISDTAGFSNFELEAGGWHGIRFNNPANSNDSSKVVYCHLEYGKAVKEPEGAPTRGVQNGAGIYVFHYDKVLIANNIIENCLGYWGGAISLRNNANPIIMNNIIRNNYAYYGTAISCFVDSSPIILGNLIYDNESRYHGTAIHLRDNCSPSIINNTICDNTAGRIGAGLFMRDNCDPKIHNSILWRNISNGVAEQGFIWEENCNPSFYNCAIEDSILGITLNPDSSFTSTEILHYTVIGFDPEFDTTVRYENYELSETSPCVNTGENIFVSPVSLGGFEEFTEDLIGGSRVFAGDLPKVDMGAFEFQGNPTEQYIFDGYFEEDYTLCADTVFAYCDIIIPNSVTLNICPGTYMEFQPVSYMIAREDERWHFPNREGGYGIYVGGSLVADAEGFDQITMTAIDSNHTWSGVLFDGFFSNGAVVSSTLNNCEIRYVDSEDNFGSRQMDFSGGAVSNYAYQDLSVENCTIHDNMGFLGGGISSFENAGTYINNNTIYNNYALIGGGIAIEDTTVFNEELPPTPPARNGIITTIENNEIYDNYAMISGGGIHVMDLEMFFNEGPGFRDMLPAEYPYQILSNNIHDNIAVSHYIIMYYIYGDLRGEQEGIDFEPYFADMDIPYNRKVKSWMDNTYENAQGMMNSRYFTNLLSFGGGGIFASYVDVNIDGNQITDNTTFGYLDYTFEPSWYDGDGGMYEDGPYRVSLGCGAGIHLRGYREDDYYGGGERDRTEPPNHPIINNNDILNNSIEVIPEFMGGRFSDDRIFENSSYATGLGAGIFSLDTSPIITDNNVTDNTIALMDTTSVYWDEFFFGRAKASSDRDSYAFPAIGFGGGVCQIAATMDTTLYDTEPIEGEVVASFVLSNNSIQGNSALYGGGVATLGWNVSYFEDNTIDYNTTIPVFFDTEYVTRDTIDFFYGVGGGIFNEGILYVKSGSISNNSSQMGGGVASSLYNGPSDLGPFRNMFTTLIIEDCDILNNNATGVLDWFAYHEMGDTVFTSGAGGGILLKEFDEPEMLWYYFEEYLEYWGFNNGLNRDDFPGGTAILDSDISYNHSGRIGGGIHVAGDNTGHDVYIEGCTITNNVADTRSGGGFSYQQHNNGPSREYPWYGSIEIRDTEFLNNQSDGYGSGCSIGESWTTIIDDCLFQGNVGTDNTDDGGGLYLDDTYFAMVTNSDFIGNYSADDGGGAKFDGIDSLLIVADCLFQENEAAEDGGGASFDDVDSMIVVGCQIIGNAAAEDGGGFEIVDDCYYVEMVDCLFEGNYTELTIEYDDEGFPEDTLDSDGGALWVEEGDSIGIVNSIFFDNYSADDGGAIYIAEFENVELVQCLVHNNEAAEDGGGLHIRETDDTDITNCTIVNNYAHDEGGGFWFEEQDPEFENTVIWGNVADSSGLQIHIEDWDYDSEVEFEYCVVQGGSDEFGWDDDGYYRDFAILDADPMFADSANGDYSITALSPCLNTGSPDTTGMEIPALDLAGNSRIFDGLIDRIDIGVYEYQGDPTTHYYMDEPIILDDVTLCYDSIFVLCDVIIPDTVTVTICPGTTVMFMSPDSSEAENEMELEDTWSWWEQEEDVLDNYGFYVDGSLIANGTVEDSIIFTAQDTLWGWNGIVFDQTDPENASSFIYCTFERGRKYDEEYWIGWRERMSLAENSEDEEIDEEFSREKEYGEEDFFGGAIYAYKYINFTVDNCLFRDNESNKGGAILLKDDFYMRRTEDMVIDKEFRKNREYGVVGPYITNTTFEDNISIHGGAASVACGYNNPYFENCNFYNNEGQIGGAVHIGGQNNPQFINCELKNNYASSNGGAIKIGGLGYAEFEDCVIDSNYSDDQENVYQWDSGGGAIKIGSNGYAEFKDCTINYNYAVEKGGAVKAGGGSYLDFYDCDFIGNTSEVDGGGLMFSGYHAELINCQFYDNYAENDGGGFKVTGSSDVLVMNTVIGNNEAGFDGGGAKVAGSSHAEFTNVTVSGNYAGSIGGGLFVGEGNVTIINTIIWNNEASDCGNNLHNEYVHRTQTSTLEMSSNGERFIYDLTNCIIGDYDNEYYGGPERYWGTFLNFDWDPHFTDPENNDFSLTGDSPAINNGTPDTSDLELPLTDVIGNDRIYQGTYEARIDIGAYEYQDDPNTMWVLEDWSSTRYWCADTVRVFTNITVPDGDTLNICPGTTIYFHPEEPLWEYDLYGPLSRDEDNYYHINIYGCILSVGEPQDSIVFTSAYGWNNGWSGIRFFSPEEDNYRSKITYSRIEFVDAFENQGIFREEDTMGAITVENYSNLRISKCVFQHNEGYSGGAISLNGESSPQIQENIFRYNFAYQGGAIALRRFIEVDNHEPVSLTRNRIEPDSTYLIYDNIFYSNSAMSGGAIFGLDHVWFNDEYRNDRSEYLESFKIKDNEIYDNVAYCDYLFGRVSDVDRQLSEKGIILSKERIEKIKKYPEFTKQNSNDRPPEFSVLGGGAIHLCEIDAEITNNEIYQNVALIFPYYREERPIIGSFGNGAGILLTANVGYYGPIQFLEHYAEIRNNDISENNIFPVFPNDNHYPYMEFSGCGAGLANFGYAGNIENNMIANNLFNLDLSRVHLQQVNFNDSNRFGNRQLPLGIGGGVFTSSSFPGNIDDPDYCMTVTHNNINNNSSINGGGIAILGPDRVVNNLIVENEVGLEFFNGYIENTTRPNICVGGGVLAAYGAEIFNNTIADNKALFGAAGMFIEGDGNIQNNIIWGNQYHENIYRDFGENIAAYFNSEDDSLIIAYNVIEGGIDDINLNGGYRDFYYEFNTDEDPLFSEEGEHPYKLTSTSSAINIGNPDTSGFGLPEYDFRDHDRIYDGYIVDAGAYEYGNNTPEEIYLDNYDVEENGPNEVFVSHLHTYDPDEEDTHTYMFIDGYGDTYNGDFEIREDSLFCMFTFDYESPTRGDGISKIAKTKPQLSAFASSGNSRPSSVSIRVRTTDSGLGNLYFDQALMINIIDMNDDPILTLPDSLYMWEDIQITFDLAGYMFDQDMDSLEIVATPTVHLNPVTRDSFVTVYPAQDWFGAELMNFTVNDNQGRAIDSDDAWIVVRPQNDDPILDITDSFTALEDMPSQVYDFTGYTSQTWGETDPLTLGAMNSNHIDVTIDDMNVVFQSNTLDWYGTEVIYFSLSDGIPVRGLTMISNSSTNERGMARDSVYVTITPVNDPPLFVVDGYFYANEDQPSQVYDFSQYTGQVWGEDDSLSLSTPGSDHIEAIINGFETVFQSTEQDWNGVESMLMTLSDNVGRAIAIDTVTVEILPINDPPVLTFIDNISMMEDTAENLGISATDVDNPQEDLIFACDVYEGELSVVVNNLAGTGDNIDITPTPDWFGDGLLIVYVTDGLATDWQAVEVEVIDENDAPVIELPETLSFLEDESLVVDFEPYITDIDLYNTLELSVVGNTEIAVDFVGLVATFTATENWSGTEDLMFTVNDNVTRASRNSGLSVSANAGNRAFASDNILVTVMPVNDVPFIYPEEVALVDTIIFDEDTTYDLEMFTLFGDADLPWGDQLEFGVSGNVEIGFSVEGVMGILTPEPDWFGNHLVTFIATDLAGEEASFEALIIVEPINDPPVIELPDEFRFAEGSSLIRNFSQYCYDVDGDPLTLTVSGNSGITVDITGLSVVFATADPLYYGEELMTFTVDDGTTRLTDSDETNVVVYYVNHAPEYIGPEIVNLLEDFEPYLVGNLDDLWVDADPEENTDLTYEIISFNPDRIHAYITPENDLMFESVLDFFGQANLVIAAIDNDDYESRASMVTEREIEIEIAAVNDAPYFVDLPELIEMGANSMYQLILDDNWVDVDDLYPMMSIVSPTGFISVTQISGYGYRFMLNSQGVAGSSEYITLNLSDGHRDVAVGSIMVIVTDSEPPLITCNIPDQMLLEDFPRTLIADLDECFTDPEGDPIEFSVEVIGEVRTLAFIADINEDNELYLTSNVPDWFGDGELLITCTEIETGLAVNQNVIVHVHPVNDPPYVANPIPDMIIDEDFEPIMVADLNDVFDDVDTPVLIFGQPIFNSSKLVAEIVGTELWLTSVLDANGISQITVSAIDELDRNFVLTSFNVDILPVYDPPSFLPELDNMVFSIPMAGRVVDFSQYIDKHGQDNSIPLAFSLVGPNLYYDVTNNEDNIYGLFVLPVGYQWAFPDQECQLFLEGQNEYATVIFTTNGSPYTTQVIDDQYLYLGLPITIDLDDYFTDPEGETLNYTAFADSEYIDVIIDGSNMTITMVELLDEEGISVTVVASDYQGTRSTADQTFTVYNAELSILLVETFDDVYNNEIGPLLSNLGFEYDYINDLVPSYDILQNYDIVIVSTGTRFWQTLGYDGESYLTEYLQNGGKLLLSAQDYMWEYYTTEYYEFIPGQFPYDMLGLFAVDTDVWEGFGDYSIAVDGVIGTFTEGVEFDLCPSGFYQGAWLFADELDWSTATPILIASDQENIGICATSYLSTVFTVAPIECIVDDQSREDFVKGSLQYLIGAPSMVVVASVELETDEDQISVNISEIIPKKSEMEYSVKGVQVNSTRTTGEFVITSNGQGSREIPVMAFDREANVVYKSSVKINFGGREEETPVYTTGLVNNMPNPFNPTTEIFYSVAGTEYVTIEIYNAKGQKMITLVDESVDAGNHSAVWNGKDSNGRSVSSGVYFYRMDCKSFSGTKKMILMK